MQIEETVGLYIENYQIGRREFKHEDMTTRYFAPLFYAQAGKVFDAQAVRESKKIIKENVGIMSSFRLLGDVLFGSMISLRPDPQAAFKDTLGVMDEMKGCGFKTSIALPFAAWEIATRATVERRQHVMNRALAYSTALGGASGDYVFAALFGLSDADLNGTVGQVAAINKGIEVRLLFDKRARQIAEMMALSGRTDGAAESIIALYEALRARKYDFKGKMQLGSLGVLQLVSDGGLVIVDEYDKAFGILKEVKGFSGVFANRELTMAIAALLVGVAKSGPGAGPSSSAATASSISGVVAAIITGIIVAVIVSAIVNSN